MKYFRICLYAYKEKHIFYGAVSKQKEKREDIS